jgi:hypothetical protein
MRASAVRQDSDVRGHDRSTIYTTALIRPFCMHKFIAIGLLGLAGCASVQLPPGAEERRDFTQTTSMPYQDAYRIIAKQMRACYRVIGVFGNGYDIQADLDSAARTGRIELYHVGLTGASKPEDSIFSRTVTVTTSGTGTVIRTVGTTPKYVYINHRAIAAWLAGSDTCAPAKD